MRFPIVIHKDTGSGYGVTVPDLPGCFSAGDTLDEGIESASEAIACHIEGLLMDGEPIPARASLEKHQGNKDYRDGVWAIVAVDISKLSSKTKRINITLPERVLAIKRGPGRGEGRPVEVRPAGSRGAQLCPAPVGRALAESPHRPARCKSNLSRRRRPASPAWLERRRIEIAPART